MSSWLEWISMGKYGVYVWSAYGIVAAGLILNVIKLKWNQRQVSKKLQQWFLRKEL